MEGGGVQTEIHVEATSNALNELASKMRNRSVPNRQMAVQLSAWVARNFSAEGRLNAPWASLAPSTANAKVTKSGARRGFDHILVQTGLLRASFQQFAYDNDSATVGSAVQYAEFHEEGTATMPMRPMLPTPDIALGIAIDVYENYIERSRSEAGL